MLECAFRLALSSGLFVMDIYGKTPCSEAPVVTDNIRQMFSLAFGLLSEPALLRYWSSAKRHPFDLSALGQVAINRERIHTDFLDAAD